MQNRSAYLILLGCLLLGQNFNTLLGSLDLGHLGLNERIFDYTGEAGIDLRDRLNNRIWYAVFLKRIILLTLAMIPLYSLNKVSNPERKTALIVAIAIVSVVSITLDFSMSFRFEHFGIFIISFILLQSSEQHGFPLLKAAVLPFIILFFSIQAKSFLGMLDTYWLISNPIYQVLAPKDGTLSEMINGI